MITTGVSIYKLIKMEKENSEKQKARLRSFDILKLFAIFLVIWGHCIQYLLSNDSLDNSVFRCISSFHMPLFMIVCGYFASSSMRLTLKGLLYKKSKQLILPCVSWTILIWIAWEVFVLWFIEGESNLSLGGFMQSIFYKFWFLKSAFLCYLLAYLGHRFGKYKLLGLLLTLLVSQVAGCFNVSNMYPCFLVGMVLNKNVSLLKDKSKVLFLISFIFFLVMLCFWDKSFWQIPDIRTALYDKDLNSTFLYFYRRFYRIIIGFAGSLTFISLFYFLFEKKGTSKIMDMCYECGQYTLGIYMLQSIIIETIMTRYVVLDNLGFVVFNFIVAPILSILVLVICVKLIKYIQKNKVLTLLLIGK